MFTGFAVVARPRHCRGLDGKLGENLLIGYIWHAPHAPMGDFRRRAARFKAAGSCTLTCALSYWSACCHRAGFPCLTTPWPTLRASLAPALLQTTRFIAHIPPPTKNTPHTADSCLESSLSVVDGPDCIVSRRRTRCTGCAASCCKGVAGALTHTHLQRRQPLLERQHLIRRAPHPPWQPLNLAAL